MRVIYLPPYSPDFNPIELAFSAIKAWIRRNTRLVRDSMMQEDDVDVYIHLYRAAFSITPAVAEAFFHHCRYI